MTTHIPPEIAGDVGAVCIGDMVVTYMPGQTRFTWADGGFWQLDTERRTFTSGHYVRDCVPLREIPLTDDVMERVAVLLAATKQQVDLPDWTPAKETP